MPFKGWRIIEYLIRLLVSLHNEKVEQFIILIDPDINIYLIIPSIPLYKGIKSGNNGAMETHFPPKKQLKILWQDDYIGIIDKPAELLMHPSSISADRDTLVGRLKVQFDIPPLPVHRLDRPVSGVIIGAYDKETAATLSQAFKEGRVKKTYVAIVRGFLTGEGEVDIPLKNADTGEMQNSSTKYKGLDTIEFPIPSRRYQTSRYSLVALSPLTGRFHQLRRHVARIGHPIIGDTSHGDTFCNHQFTELYSQRGLLLHSLTINFTHPYTGEKITVSSPLRENMAEICRKFSWLFSTVTLS